MSTSSNFIVTEKYSYSSGFIVTEKFSYAALLNLLICSIMLCPEHERLIIVERAQWVFLYERKRS